MKKHSKLECFFLYIDMFLAEPNKKSDIIPQMMMNVNESLQVGSSMEQIQYQ